MNASDRRAWMLPRRLTADAVDEWLAQALTARRGDLHLGAEGCTADIAATARLQSALCMLMRDGISPTLSVPEATLSGERAAAAFAEPDIDAPSVTPAEATLASSIEGLVLGQLCSLIPTAGLDTTRLREMQDAHLIRRSYTYGRGRSQAIAVPTAHDTPTRDTRVIDRGDALETRLADLLHNLETTEPDPRTRPWFEYVATFGLEATENTYDHGRLDFDQCLIPSIRTLAVVRHHPDQIRAVEQSTSDPRAAQTLRTYLSRLRLLRERMNLRSELRLIEVTVTDGGVGVAASMAGTFDVFDDDDWEMKALAAAYPPRGTAKPPGEIGVGHGIKKMLRASHRLRGLFTMTTGHFEFARTYLDESGRPGEHNFENKNDSAYDVAPYSWRRPLTAGTTCSILFPMDDQVVASEGAWAGGDD